MIPIYLITGFLGTGKTTLLKRLIAEHRAQPWIWLINEFSALDIDGALVSEDQPDVISIPGGSIFCRCLVTEFIGRLTGIRHQHPDAAGVVIEASGMADPCVMADMLRETGLDAHFELANIVTLVEPRSFLRLIHTLPNIIRQIEAADTVLLNKCDLFGEDQLAETEAAVRRIKPAAHIVRGIRAATDFPFIGSRADHGLLHGEYAQCRDPRYSVFTVAFGRPADTARIENLIRSHEDSIYRVKGCIPSPTGPVWFDYSKAGFSITPAGCQACTGLAWICRGDAAGRIQALAAALASDCSGH